MIDVKEIVPEAFLKPKGCIVDLATENENTPNFSVVITVRPKKDVSPFYIEALFDVAAKHRMELQPRGLDAPYVFRYRPL